MRIKNYICLANKRLGKASALFSIKNSKAFTLVEMLVALMIIGIIMAVTAPLLTQIFTTKLTKDKNVYNCVKNNNSSGWYDTTTGETNMPEPTTDAACFNSITDLYLNKRNSFDTIVYYAKQGAPDEKIIAKEMLRTACDQGGEKACSFFINECRQSAAAAVPFCDDTNNYLDLTYYLHLDKNISDNLGVPFIKSQVGSLLSKMSVGLINEASYSCNNTQSGGGGGTASSNIRQNVACDIASPKIFVEGCNIGNADACKYAYLKGYNTSCTAIKTNWPDAATKEYKITDHGDPGTTAPRIVTCDMLNLGSAAITGCNAEPKIDYDCQVGYKKLYNKTCKNVYFYVYSTSDGVYKLTKNGNPTTVEPITETCYTNSTCISGGAGTKCADGTIYAGSITTEDGVNPHPLFAYKSDNGSAVWSSIMQIATGVTNFNDGLGNTNTLLSLTDKYAPYKAAELCEGLRTQHINGRNDWYLPAKNEINAIIANYAYLPDFPDVKYSSSSEYDNMNHYAPTRSNTAMTSWKVDSAPATRCTSQIAGTNCPNVGDICDDGAVYAGTNPYTGIKLYTTQYNLHSTTWNNGYYGNIGTGANYTTDGYANYLILTTDPIINNADAPYAAENICKAMNEANGGLGTNSGGSTPFYNDWYLPSYKELDMLHSFKNIKDFSGTFTNNYYWSSTEENDASVRVIHFQSTSDITTYKFRVLPVRCVRRMY